MKIPHQYRTWAHFAACIEAYTKDVTRSDSDLKALKNHGTMEISSVNLSNAAFGPSIMALVSFIRSKSTVVVH